MQKKLEKKVLEYCDRHHMLEMGDNIVVGVSGGADSVCLLFMLLAMQKEFHLKLHVVHIHHGIRQDAGEDAAYVRELCDKYFLPFYLVERGVPILARQWGCSEEEAGRRVRYEAFEEVMRQQGCSKIAVAHNANDRAETMLFHLFRGTGLTGLGGIRPVRGCIIRPILCLERGEIETYLKAGQIAFRHDSTNDTDDYTRNKIRHHILNYAGEEIVTGCVDNMNRTADILAETENYIEEQVNAACHSCVIRQGSVSFQINCAEYAKLHGMMQKRLLLKLLKELSPMHKDITATHVEDIHSLFVKEGNRSVDLPYGIRGRRRYEHVLLDRAGQVQAQKWQPVTVEADRFMAEEGCVTLPGGECFFFRIINCMQEGINCKDIPQNQYTKWFDYDKIKECLVLRTRETGDYLCIRGLEGMQHKKVKDYMITAKLPQECRDTLPLLTEGKHVLWIPGYRISEYYKVDTTTRRILQVRYQRSIIEE